MIKLPSDFEEALHGKDTNLFPIVSIGEFTLENQYGVGNLDISTKNVQLQLGVNPTLVAEHLRTFKPLLMNIPSIKESMDFENRKYQIPRVSLRIANTEWGSGVFSDYAGNLINKEVRIWWACPTSKHFHWLSFEVPFDNTCLLVYTGIVRRYNHDENNVTLSIEDTTQKDLHKEVPIARLGDGPEVPDKYKNKPIPMVYGEVKNSPLVITRDSEQQQGEVYLYSDNTTGYGGVPPVTISGHGIKVTQLGSSVGLLKMAENGSESWLLDKAVSNYTNDNTDTLQTAQKLQFSLNDDTGLITGHVFTLADGQHDVRLSPLAQSICQASQFDLIEHDDSYGLKAKSPAININIFDETTEIQPYPNVTVLPYPTSPVDGAEDEANYTDVAIDGHEIIDKPSPSETWLENSPINLQSGQPADAAYSESRIRLSVTAQEPLNSAGLSEYYHTLIWRIGDAQMHVDAVHGGTAGHFGHVKVEDKQLSQGPRFPIWIAPTAEGDVSGYYFYTGPTEQNILLEKPHSFLIEMYPPLGGYVNVYGFQANIYRHICYWVEKPLEQNLYAHVYGRTNSLYSP